MEKIVIQNAMKTSPGIYFYPDKKVLEITGRSIPENPEFIYSNLCDWVNNYFSNGRQDLTVNLSLEYVNSGSSKFLLGALRLLASFKKTNDISLRWLYEEDDESILELGENYRDTGNIPLELEVL